MGDISKNYSLSEFTKSAIAEMNGIDNTPPASAVANIKILVNTLLQPMSDATGWVNHISSGYRCKQVNTLAKGVANSDHLTGMAADCNWYKLTNGQYQRVHPKDVVKKVKELGLPFKQIIPYNAKGFVHMAAGSGNKIVAEDASDGSDIQTQFPNTAIVHQYTLCTVPEELSEVWQNKIYDAMEESQEGSSEEDGDIYLGTGVLDILYDQIPIDVWEEYCKEKGFMITKDGGIDPEWLEYTDGSRSNFDRIVENYTPEEKDLYAEEIESKKIEFVKVGTILLTYAKNTQTSREYFENSDVFAVPEPTSNYNLYWFKKVQQLMDDSKYVPFSFGKDGGEFVQQKNLNAQVWVYSYARDVLYDITPFIYTINTQKQAKSGSFSITLSPIQSDFRSDGSDMVRMFRNRFFEKNTQLKSSHHTIIDWFTTTFQYNDVVFIRYELLSVENGKVTYPSYNRLPPNALSKDKCWDMIGLVDKISPAVSYESNDYSLSITGRDFMKIFEDDGYCFINRDLMLGSYDNFIVNTEKHRNNTTNDPSLNRNDTLDGEIMWGGQYHTIKEFIGFIFDRLHYTRIVPENSLVFSNCKRTGSDVGIINPENSKGIWDIFKVWVEDALNDRVIVNHAFTNPNGTMMNFFDLVCQEPFVEYFGDTWGAGYDMIVRKPPFDRAAISKCLPSLQALKDNGFCLWGTHILNKDLLGHNLSFDTRAYSWWRLTASQGPFAGDGVPSNWMYPVFYVDELVEHFGNKRCEVQDPYLHVGYLGGMEATEQSQTLYARIASDYVYLVESTIYLPFTRTGTITINGDRRIKVGTFVILDATNELFYVTGVSNNISFSNNSVDRTTTITVERGMRIDIWENYFNIVNIEQMKKVLSEKIQKMGGFGSDCEVKEKPEIKTLVNKVVLENFFKRTQFAHVNFLEATVDAGGDGMMGTWGDGSETPGLNFTV